MPRVSVIIPCYNQGAVLDEAVDSVLSQTFKDLEIIVVNDGSTDELTIKKCAGYQHQKTQVIVTSNQGLAAARNNGISQSQGEYILPLDADDRIESHYLEKAVEVLDNEPDTGIVYCRSRLFGAIDAEWLLPDYSLHEMLKDNVIFCSALFRKADWQRAGGYDTGMIYGWEDYDFWLSLIEQGREVRRLPGHHFFYRVSSDSMVRSKEKWQKIQMFKRIYQRHTRLFGEHIEVWLEALLEKRERYLTSRLYVDCGNGVSDRDSLARKIETGVCTITFSIIDFANRRALRFDPVDCPACLEIISIELVYPTCRETVDLGQLKSNALYREDNYFMFSSSDPQVYLSITDQQLMTAREVIITYGVELIGEDALQKIVSYQTGLLRAGKGAFPWSKWLGYGKGE